MSPADPDSELDQLSDIQARLEDHFDRLARSRAASGFPVFALEHGLSPKDLERLRSTLQTRRKTRAPTARHWLLWIVYATELGYDYQGDEYWPSFEDQTPGWQDRHRDDIRIWFQKFQSTYRGGTPSGPWAQQFGIIAWPITHAVLPLYLQRQFAKLLYQLRFRLASLDRVDPRSLGRLLAAHARDASTRFRAFLEQEELTAQLVLALLGAHPSNGEDLIHAPTLERIVADLKIRRAGQWLAETQHVVSDRFKGIGRGSGASTALSSTSTPTAAAPDTSHITIRPNLALHHTGGDRWVVSLQLKSLRPIAALSPDIESFLDRTRCQLNGAPGLKPGGWLLSGDRKNVLRSWPDASKPVVRFEHSNAVVDGLLDSDCRLSRGPTWLFRLGRDGPARHVASRVVRPNHNYIVATTGPIPDDLPGATPCQIACEGVNAYYLAVPAHVSAELTERFQTFGLQVARTVRVWPAGLPGRGWDGEGASEWLTTESPCFAVATDHPVEELSLRLNEQPIQTIRTPTTGVPAFIQLPALQPGVHTLTVQARRDAALDLVAPTPPAEGFMRLAVREPEPWVPGVTTHPGLVLTMDPHDADLDTLWRNELSLAVNGPAGFSASVDVTLRSADDSQILSQPVAASMELPIAADQWKARFHRFLTNEAHASTHLEAASCALTITAETLGSSTVVFEHDPKPLRWVAHSRRGIPAIRLVDDTGQHHMPPETHFYPMDRPLDSQPLPADQILPPGGLFLAKRGLYTDSVVVSAGLADAGLKALGVTPRFGELPSDPRALTPWFDLLRQWKHARLSGFLVGIRHRMVLNGIISALSQAFSGSRWGRAESAYQRTPSPSTLGALSMHVDRRSTGFAVSLRAHAEADGDARDIPSLASWFADTAARCNVSRDRNVSRFALLLAIRPFEAIDHPNFAILLGKLAKNRILFRGARLVAILQSDALRETREPRSQH